MVQAGRASSQALQPLNDSIDKLNKGKASFQDIGRIWKNQQSVLKTHSALLKTNYERLHATGGAARVAGVNVAAHGTASAAAGLKLRFFNTLVHAGSTALVNWGKNVQWAGRQVTVGITVPLALLGRTATRVAEEYDAAMVRVTKVTSFSADANTAAYDRQVAALENRVRSMARLAGEMYGYAPADSGSVMAEYAQMGFRGNMLDTMTEETLKVAYVSGTELPQAINMARVTLQAYGNDYEDIGEQMARFNIIENNTALSIQEMATALPIVASVASQLNISAAETAGLIAMQKEAGIDAAEGAAALRTGLIRLVQDATDPAITAFEKLNINLVEMQAANAGNTLGFLQDLGDEFRKVEPGTLEMDQFIAAIGKLAGTRQAARLTAILAQIPDIAEEGTDAFRIWQGATMDGAAALAVYEAEYERLANSASGTATRLRAAIQVELAEIGKPILEMMNTLRQALLNILQWFNGLDEGVQKVILTMMGFAGAIGPIGMILGITANAIGSVARALSSLLPRILIVNNAMVAAQAIQDAKMLTDLAGAAAMDANTAAAFRQAAAHREAAAAQAINGGAGAKRIATGARTGVGAAVGAAGSIVGGLARGGIPGSVGRAASKRIGIGAIDFTGMSMAGGAPAAGAGRAAVGTAAKVAGIAGGTATIAGALALFQTLVQDWERFKQGFMEVVDGPLERFKSVWESLVSTFKNMFTPITSGEVTSSLGTVSEWVGRIAGFLGGVILDAINAIIVAVDVLASMFTSIVRLVQGIAAVLMGDWQVGMDLFNEAWLATASIIGNVLADIFDWLNEGLGFDFISQDFINGLRDVGREYNNLREVADITRTENERLNGVIEGAAGAFEAARQNGDAFLETLAAAGRTVPELAELHGLFMEVSDAVAAAAEGELIGLDVLTGIADTAEERVHQAYEENRITQLQRDDLLESLQIMEAQYRVNRDTLALQAAMVTLEEARRNAANASAGEAYAFSLELRAAINNAENLEESLNLSVEELETLKALAAFGASSFDDMDDAAESAADNTARYASSMRSAVSSVQGDVARAVQDSLSQQNEAMREAQRARTEALKEWADDQKDIIEQNAETEEDRIRDIHETKIAALQEEQEVESELERFRQYVFDKEKARLSYFSSRAAKQINMQVALARGELSTAAILQEEMGADQATFQAENRRRDEQRTADERTKLREQEIDLIEERMETQLETLEAEVEAQEAALEQQVENREDALERQARSEEAAYDLRRKFVERTLKDWQEINPKTEAEWADHLNTLQTDLNGAAGEWSGIVQSFSDTTGGQIQSGFVDAFEDARRKIEEDDKWEAAGDAVARMFTEGFNAGLEGIGLSLATDNQYANLDPNKPNVAMHTGGPVQANGGRGLKPDEAPIIAQAGEFMIQRKAAKVLGPDMLTNLNNAHKYHTGGEISFKDQTTPGGIGNILGQAFKHDSMSIPGGGFAGGTGNIGEYLGLGQFTTGGSWPARQWATLASNTRAAMNFWRDKGIFPDGIGTGVHRGDPRSDHSYGKALDFMVAKLGKYAQGDQVRQGWDVANWHVRNPGMFGTKDVIWNGLINSGSGWKPYTRYGSNPGATRGHYDHVHVSYMHEGGAVAGLDPNNIRVSGNSPMLDMASTLALRAQTSGMIQKSMPQLAKGAHINYDNVVANLHRGETVLTSDLSNKLIQGIERLESGGGPTVIQIENFHGTEQNIEKLAKRIEQVQRKQEIRRGARRTMN